MNKTDIDYGDYALNEVTGCTRGCPYCFARRHANRFKGFTTNGGGKSTYRFNGGVLESPLYIIRDNGKIYKAPYPFGFEPTFHRYRLAELQRTKKPGTVLHSFMGDLFNDNIPDEWIQETFAACEKAPQHRHLFLTKNPERYHRYEKIINSHANWWFGATSINYEKYRKALYGLRCLRNVFISAEPLQEDLNGEYGFHTHGTYSYNHGNGIEGSSIDWIIIGAETGNRKGKVIPKREWVKWILEQCREANVPVFMKSNLRDVWGEDLIQEYPW